MSAITTHVLDTARGRPAVGVSIILERQTDTGWQAAGQGHTDANGRAAGLLPPGAALLAGTYRLTFALAAYFQEHGVAAFFPEASVVFDVRVAGQDYHVPLLVSPYGYTTYRGS